MMMLKMLLRCFAVMLSSQAAVSIDQLLCPVHNAAPHHPQCRLYLKKSTIPGAGRGVFAGKYFEANEKIDEGPTLLVRGDDCIDTQLEDYVFASDHDDYSMVAFGASSLYNSRVDKSVHYHWSTEANQPFISAPESLNSSLPFTNYTKTTFYASRVVEDGEELISHYGNGWFEARNISAEHQEGDTPLLLESIEPEIVADETALPQVCLSDIEVLPSTIDKAGLGVFATKNFQRGDLVTVSPVLVLSRHMVESTVSTSLLLNYCIFNENSSFVILPIGKSAMINHQSVPLDNVELRWFSWSSPDAYKLLDLSEFLNSNLAGLDIAYVAKRNICKGEELVMNYGKRWESDWVEWNGQNNQGKKFRSYITTPIFH